MNAGEFYEVRCPSCDVSFAPGTRSCLHCGGRIPRGGGLRPTSRDPEGSFEGSLPFPELSDSESEVRRGAGAGTDEGAPADEATRPWWFRLGGNVVWVLLALVAAITQMCERG
ncbi:MAG: hypothetical protein VCB78_09080 [Myxococcota bacterium]|jgi:hypothetical protein